MLAGIQGTPYNLYHLFWCVVDWFYPPTCGGCERTGERWCSECQQQVEKITGPICPRCGLPQRGNRLCSTCRAIRPEFDQLRSWGVYKGPLRLAIHKLKYRRDLGLAEPLANHLAHMLASTNWNVDLITCVPLNNLREKERGYNQSKEIARPLALQLRKPFHPRVIQRIRDTVSQVGLTAEERSQNVHGAFRAQKSSVTGKNVLLVDDVATTGATINACASALREAGAAHVYGLTVARAVRLSDHTVEAEANP